MKLGESVGTFCQIFPPHIRIVDEVRWPIPAWREAVEARDASRVDQLLTTFSGPRAETEPVKVGGKRPLMLACQQGALVERC